jgi:hypothetical protein
MMNFAQPIHPLDSASSEGFYSLAELALDLRWS